MASSLIQGHAEHRTRIRNNVQQPPVRAQNPIRGCEQRSCDAGDPAVMITDHVPAGSTATVRCNVRTPRMNAVAERWIGGCRRELLDRTLVWNRDHLRRILRQYETHHNLHRPHRSLHAAAPLKPLPQPVDLDQHRIRKRACVGGLINEYRLVARCG
jgi:transposase InsO family protein